MFFTYILHSEVAGKFYVGVSQNPNERLRKHNAKNKGFTNRAQDWKIVFTRSFPAKTQALVFEKEIKSWKSKVKIQRLIQNQSNANPTQP